MHSANREIQTLKQKYSHTDKHMDTQTRTQTYKRTETLIIKFIDLIARKKSERGRRVVSLTVGQRPFPSIPSNFNFKSVLTTTARNTSALL